MNAWMNGRKDVMDVLLNNFYLGSDIGLARFSVVVLQFETSMYRLVFVCAMSRILSS